MFEQLGLGLRDVAALGQIFTPDPVVRAMLALRRNTGRVLEPSCGDGAFLRHLPGAVGLELDPDHCPQGAQHKYGRGCFTVERFRYINLPKLISKELRGNQLALPSA